MDIAKYIGLFLLKNRFCYLHGIGNLELKKKPAVYDGLLLQGSSYEVIIGSAGSIDDNLTNFIANNEQISVSKASSMLREYCADIKYDIQHGKEVVIPYIGRLAEEYGRTIFITEPILQHTPSPIATQRVNQTSGNIPAERGYEKPHYRDEPVYDNKNYPDHEPEPEQREYDQYEERYDSGKREKLNWGKIIITALIVIVVITSAVFGFKLFKTQSEYQAPVKLSPVVVDSSLLKAQGNIQADNSSSGTANTTATDDSTKLFKFSIESFNSRKLADKKAMLMRTYGHEVEVYARDSSAYMILMLVHCKPADTTRIKDSLGSLYPNGVNGVNIYY